jgi:hypothetical protein
MSKTSERDQVLMEIVELMIEEYGYSSGQILELVHTSIQNTKGLVIGLSPEGVLRWQISPDVYRT